VKAFQTQPSLHLVVPILCVAKRERERESRPLVSHTHLAKIMVTTFVSDVGVTTIAFFAAGVPLGLFPRVSKQHGSTTEPEIDWYPCLSKVQMSVMACRVFPRPISSAKMHPRPGPFKPIVHSYMNFTPSRWWGCKMLKNTPTTRS
jgi:hypothetical protein